MSANIEQHSAQTGGKSATIVRDVLAGIGKELRAVRRELADAQDSARQMYSDLGELEKRLADSEKRGEMLDADLEEAARLRLILEETVADANVRIQELSNENERIATVEELIDELKKKNNAFTEKVLVDSEEIAGLSLQLASERALREALAVDLDVSRRLIGELRQALARAKETPP